MKERGSSSGPQAVILFRVEVDHELIEGHYSIKTIESNAVSGIASNNLVSIGASIMKSLPIALNAPT